jgi:hypothetical protein
MGVDLRILTGHRLSAEEAVNFGPAINDDPLLKELDFFSSPSKKWKSWQETATAKQLAIQWENNLGRNCNLEGGYWDGESYDFETFSDYISFYPELVVTYGWYSRFRVMEDEVNRRLICAFYNRFAQLFQQKYIVLYADSSRPSSFIADQVYSKSLTEILEMMREKFGFKQLSDMTGQWFQEFGFYIHAVKY